MTRETDFLDLYRRLGLNPGCDLEALKQAYRRHVAALHPDRRQGLPADGRAEARLQLLTSQYGAAMEFHRRHGRLPGARVSPAQAAPKVPGEWLGERPEAIDPFTSARAASFQGPLQGGAKTPLRRSHTKLIVLLIIVAAATLGWMAHDASSPPAASDNAEDASALSSAASTPAEAGASEATLHVGMTADEVREVEGEPLAMHGSLWEYGPSWIRFDHDAVVEWHSSPLRPLHTGAMVGHP